MTLHWWMHWFWVTAQVSIIIGIPVPSTTEDPQFERDLSLAWKTLTVRMTPEPPDKPSMRLSKAISSYEPSIKVNSVGMAGPVVYRQSFNASKVIKKPHVNLELVAPSSTEYPSIERLQPSPSLINGNSDKTTLDEENPFLVSGEIYQKRKDTRITWILTTKRPIRRKTNDDDDDEEEEEEQADEEENIEEEKFSKLSGMEDRDLTVLPLRLEETRFKLVVNRSRTINGDTDTVSFSSRTFNDSEDILIDQELAEPRLSSETASPVLHASLPESTRLSRARTAFSDDFQRDRVEDRSSQDDEDDVVDGNGIIRGATAQNATASVLDIAAITGSCLAMVVLLSTMASIGFVMYRKKYLNPPQTLNSDKCSNPDSSGYIDDSTMRDNSEEMYSLDNDSFLNSLEAMTIQNYWTDSVKHTKL